MLMYFTGHDYYHLLLIQMFFLTKYAWLINCCVHRCMFYDLFQCCFVSFYEMPNFTFLLYFSHLLIMWWYSWLFEKPFEAASRFFSIFLRNGKLAEKFFFLFFIFIKTKLWNRVTERNISLNKNECRKGSLCNFSSFHFFCSPMLAWKCAFEL